MIRVKDLWGRDLYLGAVCIESIMDMDHPPNSCRVVMQSGAKHELKVTAGDLYRGLTNLGYTMDSMIGRGVHRGG